MRFDAVVIGAGPAGAAAARLLAEAGWSVALVEKAEFPRRKVCGEFISAASLPVLEACGVGDEFIADAGPPVRRVGGYAGARMIEAVLPRAHAGWGRALGREKLDVLLRDAALAAGARLFQPAELTALRKIADGHSAVLRTAEGEAEISARIVIAACGSWNAKGPFAVDAPPRGSDLFAFKGHFHGSALPAGLIPLLAFSGGYGGMVQTDEGRVSLSCCIRRDTLARVRERHGGKAGEAVLAYIRETTEGVRRALQDATPDGAILASGPIRPGIRPRHADGVFFTGNIAGEAHPIIAEGISMAIQSSWLLAQCLIAAGPNAGPQFAKAWRKQFGPRLHAASLFARIAMDDRGRATAARLIEAFPRILTWGAALSGKATPIMPPRARTESGGGVRHAAS